MPLPQTYTLDRPARKVKHTPLKFLGEFIRQPKVLGSVIPSSPTYMKFFTRQIDLHGAKVVVEIGPGTGVATEHILPRLPQGCRFFAVELSHVLAKQFRRNFPEVTLHERSAADLPEICRLEGVEQVDAIYSGLPWASFSEPLQRSLLEAIRRVLKPGGKMVTLGYNIGELMENGKRFYKQLAPRYFSRVGKSKLVWRNVPPGFVFWGVK